MTREKISKVFLFGDDAVIRAGAEGLERVFGISDVLHPMGVPCSESHLWLKAHFLEEYP
jgi:hypothetical protein